MNIAKINKERLSGWEKKCTDGDCIPEMLLTLQPYTGQLGIVICEDLDVEHLKIMLTHILKNL